MLKPAAASGCSIPVEPISDDFPLRADGIARHNPVMEAIRQLPPTCHRGHSTDQQDLRGGTFIDCHHLFIFIIATRERTVEPGGVTPLA
jgi:hypothetical protein